MKYKTFTRSRKINDIMKEHTRRLQGTVEELEKRNYYLEREDRVLRGFVGNYQGQNRTSY